MRETTLLQEFAHMPKVRRKWLFGLPAADQGGLLESGPGKNSGRSVASRIHAEVPSSRGL